MNYKMMGRLIALILLAEAAFMVPALIISLAGQDSFAIMGFVVSILVIFVVAGLLLIFGRKARRGFYAREGMVCVGLAWIVMSLLGCLPFWISREIPSYLDALFEIVSGFTTTGASILSNVEGLSNGMLYWRSFSHWVGGMGVLVFLLAVVPVSGRNDGFTMHLLRAESPGPNVAKLVPRIRSTAGILYILYIVLTIVTFIFLMIGKMPVLEAVCTAFGTAGTGGFGVKNDSMASYSPYIQNVCTVFMLLFGVNFSCYYMLIMKQFKNVYQDEELRLYIGMVLGSVVLIVINLRGFYGTLGETIRHAFFQVASIITTTGFATTDFDLWPGFSKTILLCLMVVGACAGSTGGGFKCGRLLLVFKSLRRNLQKMLRPQRIQAVRSNKQVVSEKVLENTNAYLAAYVLIIMFSFLVISLDGFSVGTNFSAVLSCFNNIGPGLEMVGPTCNFSIYSPMSKIMLIIDMLAGRLEIFPILILLSRDTWRR
jgi:trk system potassium uptake protein